MVTHRRDKLHEAMRVCRAARTNSPVSAGWHQQSCPCPVSRGDTGAEWGGGLGQGHGCVSRRCKRRKAQSSPSTSFPNSFPQARSLSLPLPVIIKFHSHNKKFSATGISRKREVGKKGSQRKHEPWQTWREDSSSQPAFLCAGFTCIILFSFPFSRLFDFCIIYGLSSGPVFAVIVSFSNKID